MATVGGKDIIPKGISTVIGSWTDDEWQLHTKRLNNILYFSYSLFKIQSTNVLAESMKFDYGTCIITKINYSVFSWYFGKYKNTIAHSENYLPEL